MPFDGSGLLGSSIQDRTIPIPSEGRWHRLRQAWRALLPTAREPQPDGEVRLPGLPKNEAEQVLHLARALIADERHWVQRRYETLDGRRCAVGALRAAARLLSVRGSDNGPHNALLSVAQSRGFTDVERMNDHSTHVEVLSAFDTAIVRTRFGL